MSNNETKNRADRIAEFRQEYNMEQRGGGAYTDRISQEVKKTASNRHRTA